MVLLNHSVRFHSIALSFVFIVQKSYDAFNIAVYYYVGNVVSIVANRAQCARILTQFILIEISFLPKDWLLEKL